jgi:hypothetical protein
MSFALVTKICFTVAILGWCVGVATPVEHKRIWIGAFGLAGIAMVALALAAIWMVA